jgi:hypothetical protein
VGGVRKIRLAGHVEYIEQNRTEMRKLCWWGNLKERCHFEDLGMYERVILKWIHLSLVTKKYWALLDTITKLRVS